LLFEKARAWGSLLEPQRRERLLRIKARANVAALEAEMRAGYEDHADRQARATALRRRAVDLEFGTYARGHVAAARIEKDGGVEAFVAREAADLAPAWPGVAALGLAQRAAFEANRGSSADAVVAARAEVARLEQARAAWCDQQARALLSRATAGEPRSLFQAFSRDVAALLAGPAATWCAYLADVEDFPSD
jgi:hypothetical protein